MSPDILINILRSQLKAKNPNRLDAIEIGFKSDLGNNTTHYPSEHIKQTLDVLEYRLNETDKPLNPLETLAMELLRRSAGI